MNKSSTTKKSAGKWMKKPKTTPTKSSKSKDKWTYKKISPKKYAETTKISSKTSPKPNKNKNKPKRPSKPKNNKSSHSKPNTQPFAKSPKTSTKSSS
jgi:hypothetical protein